MSTDAIDYAPPEPERPGVLAAFRSRRVLVRAAGIAAVSAALGSASYAVRAPGDGAAIWLPLGALIVLALRADPHTVPVHLAGAIAGLAAAGSLMERPVAVALAAAIGSAAGAAAAAAVVRRFRTDPPDSPASVGWLIGICAVAAPALVAAALAVAGADDLLVWLAGAAVPAACIVPLALFVHDRMMDKPVSVLAFAALTAVVTAAAYAIEPDAAGAQRGMALVAVPLVVMIAAAVRAGPRAAAASALAFAVIAIPLTAMDRGPFASPRAPAEGLVAVDVFVAITAVAVLLLATVVRAQRAGAEAVSQQAQSFDTIASSAPIGIFVLDADGRCVSVNPRFTALCGMSADDARGTGWLDMVHPVDRDRIALRWRTAFAEHLGVAERFRVLGPQGSVRWASAVLEPRRTGTGRVTGFVGILSDVTGEVEADDAKSSFLARTSHELRTPLTIIMGLAQTLMRPGLDDDQRAQMNKTIVDTATRLNALIDRLLAASAEPAGIEAAVAVPLDLLDIVDAAAEIARERGFDVVVDVQPGIRALAPSDAVRDVLAELVGNAVKFSPGGGSVSIDARQDDAAVVVGVSDWGIGMDDEQQQRCFDRFWQAESKDTRRYEGTGIGLTVARSLVEGWGGSIGVRSVLGSGSRFEFTIPRAGARSKSA